MATKNTILNGQHNAVSVNMQPEMLDESEFDPNANLYVKNLPKYYTKSQLYNLFAAYGIILRNKVVNNKNYGFVQFKYRQDCNNAMIGLNNYSFPTGEIIQLSIAIPPKKMKQIEKRPKRNVYIKGLPNTWNQTKLIETFNVYGTILRSCINNGGVAFVEYKTHKQALNAIKNMDKLIINNQIITVRFATRNTNTNLNLIDNHFAIDFDDKKVSNNNDNDILNQLQSQLIEQQKVIDALQKQNKCFQTQITSQNNYNTLLIRECSKLFDKYCCLKKEKFHSKIFNDILKWDIDDIIIWINYLENGRYSKYKNILMTNMQKENINGHKLLSLTWNDLHRLGILDFIDKEMILKHIASLSNDIKNQQLEGN